MAAALRSQGWDTTVLRQLQARPERIRAELAKAALLHYAGHAARRGREGFDSGLLLADGELNVSDVLTAPAAPETVLLVGCETGRTEGPLGRGGISLAHAFVAAGASHVVATGRPIKDDLGAAIAAAFAEHLQEGKSPAAAYRAALPEVIRAHPQEDWAAFRLWVP